MSRMKQGLTGILASVLTTLAIVDAAMAVSMSRGSRQMGDDAFDAMIYRARDPRLCDLPIQLICRDIPGQGSITKKFYPDSFFLFSLDPDSRRVEGGLYQVDDARLRRVFPSTPASQLTFAGDSGVSSWNVESSSYRITADGNTSLKLLFKDAKATQAYSYDCTDISYPAEAADIRPVGCSSQFFSRKLMKWDGSLVTLPVFHLDRDPNLDGGEASGGNPIDASVYRIDCSNRTYSYVSRGWLDGLASLRYTTVDTLPAVRNGIEGSPILRTLYPDVCPPRP